MLPRVTLKSFRFVLFAACRTRPGLHYARRPGAPIASLLAIDRKLQKRCQSFLATVKSGSDSGLILSCLQSYPLAFEPRHKLVAPESLRPYTLDLRAVTGSGVAPASLRCHGVHKSPRIPIPVAVRTVASHIRIIGRVSLDPAKRNGRWRVVPATLCPGYLLLVEVPAFSDGRRHKNLPLQ